MFTTALTFIACVAAIAIFFIVLIKVFWFVVYGIAIVGAISFGRRVGHKLASKLGF